MANAKREYTYKMDMIAKVKHTFGTSMHDMDIDEVVSQLKAKYKWTNPKVLEFLYAIRDRITSDLRHVQSGKWSTYGMNDTDLFEHLETVWAKIAEMTTHCAVHSR